MDKGKDAYELAAECANCGWSGQALIPRGEKRPGFKRGVLGPIKATCPQCGCDEVVCPLSPPEER